jgi:hypothetical protein
MTPVFPPRHKDRKFFSNTQIAGPLFFDGYPAGYFLMKNLDKIGKFRRKI